jgi:hypothetical protein
VVRARLALPPDQVCTHPETGATRWLSDCPDVPLTEHGPRIRLLVATHPAAETKPSVGVQRGEVVSELCAATLAPHAFSPKDVCDLSLHRGAFETVLADEDAEQATDRWCSQTPCGQEFWHVVNQWVWNLRVEFGQQLASFPMRTTALAAASDPPAASGPAQWARRSFPGGFPGSAFLLQPDGTLLCPAACRLSPQERRPERGGRTVSSLRLGLVIAAPVNCVRCVSNVLLPANLDESAPFSGLRSPLPLLLPSQPQKRHRSRRLPIQLFLCSCMIGHALTFAEPG